MNEHRDPGGVSVKETRLLRFLCQDSCPPPLHHEILERLRGHAFQEMEHQMLFDCLRRLPDNRPEWLKDLLPERMVRAGFPGFDLESFLCVPVPSATQAAALCEELLSSGPADGGLQ